MINYSWLLERITKELIKNERDGKLVFPTHGKKEKINDLILNETPKVDFQVYETLALPRLHYEEDL